MSQDARLDQERSTEKRADVLHMPYIDTSQIHDKTLFRHILSVEEIRSMRVVPIDSDNYSINFGITTTTPQNTMKHLSARFINQKLTFSIISDVGYDEYVRLYDPPPKIEYQDISIKSDPDADSIEQISATLSTVRPDDMLAYLVKQAFQLEASDIHLEKHSEGARIRLRVHGVLHAIAKLDDNKYRQLMSVLASAANISTSADDDQTGQINTTYKMATGEEVTVNLRVETVPAVNGIDAVLRLFNFREDMLSLGKLGLNEYQNEVIKDIISHPTGLVLIVGPTGSGKTTTLYSILNELNNDERKIITLEDPVEYHIEGITQIPVKSRQGQSFSDKFRAVLRLDPDVIMVGEIRDTDTAKTALQAALTGHLVLSTYHAGSAAAAVTRLLDAIGENPLYASAIRLIQAQRLVRRLDDTTKTESQITEEVQKYIQKVVNSIKSTNADLSSLSNAKIFTPGKSDDNPFGFSGQFAIRELLTMTPNMQKLLTKPAHELSTELIEQTAVDDGMLTIKQDGVLRVLKGDTTVNEIMRVVD